MPYTLPEKKIPVAELTGKWEGKRLNDNAITLDFASYSTDQGKTFSKPEPVIGIFSRLNRDAYNGDLILSYPVNIDVVPQRAGIVVEQPEMYSSITLNGNPLNFDHSRFYIDHSFPVANASGMLKKGKNILSMELQFRHTVDTSRVASERYGTEIESIYLIGDFSVKAKKCTTTMDSQRNSDKELQPKSVHGMSDFFIDDEQKEFSGDLATEGYPFYAGAFELKKSFRIDKINPGERFYLDLPNCEAIAMVVSLNGTLLDTLCWSPFSAELTQAIHEGKNELSLTLVNSLRNLMGPHHQKRAEMTRVGPYSFTGAGGFPDPKGDSNWYDLRLTGKPTRLWTDTYYSIPFGFIETPEITKMTE